MENKNSMKKMIELNKMSFNNCFSTMLKLQDQSEKFMWTLVSRSPGMSDESKKMIGQWTDIYKKGITDFKKMIDEGYAKWEAFYDGDGIGAFQDHAEKIFHNFINQKNWMPKDWNQTTEELTAIYKRGYDDFWKYLDGNIKRMGSYSLAADNTQVKS